MARDDRIVFQHDRDQITVRDLREWHYLEVTCAGCGRIGLVYQAVLWKCCAACALIVDVARRFRCSRCWTKGSARWNVMKIDRGA